MTAYDYSDWYLPAKDELNLFYNSGNPIGGVKTDGTYYESSTEYLAGLAYYQRFNDGWQNQNGPKNVPATIRCVRR